jgi:hypothetical protein
MRLTRNLTYLLLFGVLLFSPRTGVRAAPGCDECDVTAALTGDTFALCMADSPACDIACNMNEHSPDPGCESCRVWQNQYDLTDPCSPWPAVGGYYGEVACWCSSDLPN